MNSAAVATGNTVTKTAEPNGKKLYVRINTSREPVAVNILTDSIKGFPGNMPVIIVDAGKMENGKPTVLAADSSKWVENNDLLIQDLINRFGEENVKIK